MESPEKPSHLLRHLLVKGQSALHRGERADARRTAQRAVSLAPLSAAAWRLLAAVSTGRAREEYLARAAELDGR